MATYDVNWSATLDDASSTIEAGTITCPVPNGDSYVIANAANFAAVGRLGGVALTLGAPPTKIIVQYSGEVPKELTGLGTGAIAAVRLSATGFFERIVGSPTLADYILGDCSADGSVTLRDTSFVNPFVGSGLAFEDEGTPVITASTANFVGAGVAVTNVGGVATVTVSGGGTVTNVTGVPPIASTGGATPAISISAATTGAAGSLSAADKIKLNSVTSGAAVASVGGTAPIASTGGTTPVISIAAASGGAAGSMSAADKAKLDGITAGAAVSTVSGTAPIVSSGGTTPDISINAATTSLPGSLSAADKTKIDKAQFNGLDLDSSPVFLQGGGGATAGQAGSVIGGNGTVSTPGGGSSLIGGNGLSGGRATLQGGSGTGAGGGGDVRAVSGVGGTAGTIALTVADGISFPGAFTIQGGTSPGGSSPLSMVAGNGTGAVGGGDTTVGAGASGSGLGGLLQASGGDGGTGTGGDVNIFSGGGNTASGAVTVSSSDSPSGIVGLLTLAAGGDGTSVGGKIEVAGGFSASNGHVLVSGFDGAGAATVRVKDTIAINAPILADGTAFTPAPFSCHGVYAVPSLLGGNQIVSSGNSINSVFIAVGVIPDNTRTLTLTCTPADGGIKWVANNTTGADFITVFFASGTGVQVPTGRYAMVYGDGTNAQVLLFTKG